jgi:hypothetical protein
VTAVASVRDSPVPVAGLGQRGQSTNLDKSGWNGSKVSVRAEWREDKGSLRRQLPEGVENSAQGCNPEGKARRLTYDRQL